MIYKSLKKSFENLMKANQIPFHMPGHKRNYENDLLNDAYKIDITEVTNFDDLANPKGVLNDLSKKISSVYGTRKSFPLVNGSTVGILSSIYACFEENDKIIYFSNAHKSVLNAIRLKKINGIRKEFHNGDSKRENFYSGLEKTIVEKKPKGLIITSPTYEGEIVDINKISKLCKKNKIILIVDEAHGSHLRFIDKKLSAVQNGADVVIQSFHKTMPSLTQTAVIHVCSRKIDLEKIKSSINIFQTSSPSYVLLYSIENMICEIENGIEEKYVKQLRKLNEFKIRARKYLYNFDTYKKEETRVIINPVVFNLSSKKLFEILSKKYNIECEGYFDDYIILITSPYDDFRWYDDLGNALDEIYEKHKNKKTIKNNGKKSTKELEYLKSNIGEICKYTFYQTPPEIPIIEKGEIIKKSKILEIENKIKKGIKINYD